MGHIFHVKFWEKHPTVVVHLVFMAMKIGKSNGKGFENKK